MMKSTVLHEYLKDNFSKTPKDFFEWRYDILDTLDEWAWGFGGTTFFAVLYFFGQKHGWEWLKLVAAVGLGACLIYLTYWFCILFFRRRCMHYELRPDHFVYTHGLFRQNTETYQLSDILRIDLERNWWERIVRVGTLKIYFKKSSGVSHNPLVIRGIRKYNQMFEQIDYYRNYHRLVLYLGI